MKSDSSHPPKPHTGRAPLRIAQIVSLEADVPPKSQNGLEFIVSWITEGMIRRGHQVTLFAPDNSTTSARHISTQPEQLRFDPKKVWQQPIRSMWNTTVAAMMADEFDIIHSHTGTIVFHAPFISTPAIHTLHHPAEHDVWRNLLNEPAIKKQVEPIARAFNMIHHVAVSNKQKELFQANGGDYFFSQVDVVHNGIPTSQFVPRYDAGDYLLFLGYITPHKGAHIAIDIAKRSHKKLVIAGNYYGEEEYFNTQIAPHLNDDITYVGTADFEQKTKLYQHAEALLVPIQWDEPFGLTLIEAAACGTPVIAFNRGASAEIIKDGVTGFVCTNEDEAVAAVARLHTIDRRTCRLHTEEHFDAERMLDEYEALYYSLANKSLNTSTKNSPTDTTHTVQ